MVNRELSGARQKAGFGPEAVVCNGRRPVQSELRPKARAPTGGASQTTGWQSLDHYGLG